MRQLIVSGVKAVLWFSTFTARPLAVALAFRLFCYPHKRSKPRAGERRMMARAQTETVTIRGHRVCVYRWGSGEHPVLLLHGWESCGARFAPLAERLLALGYTPITFDSPGHGESGDDKTTILDYVEICEALHQRYGNFAAIVAHSFGTLGAFYALKQKVRARCIVAISGVSDFRYLLDAFCAQLGLFDSVKEGMRRRIEVLFLPIDDIWNRFSVTNATEEIRQPVLVIHDRRDEVVDMEQGRRTASHFGVGAHLHITEGLGHNRILRDKKVIDTVCDFIQNAPVDSQYREHEPVARGD